MSNYIGMKLDGRYELLELIGSGGMAEIYKATDTVEERTVAVKILKNEFAGSDDFLRRFRNESKAIALLSHPNIVKIFDVGFTDSIRFIVMEYVDGITLTEYISRQGVLKWKEAHSYISQILKALQHAHDRGIVHRDVKSQNVMLLRDGSIKVMDFGIARFNREIDKTMSEKEIMGSVHYISPEQARGKNTDEKSDLYSVGVMLYEMLTGVKPFDIKEADRKGKNEQQLKELVQQIAKMHTDKAPKPPREINSSIPGGLEEIILRAMQKDTAQRYQSSFDMLVDLQEFEKNPYIVFEYKYSTPAGEPKHIDKAGKPAAPPITLPAPNSSPSSSPKWAATGAVAGANIVATKAGVAKPAVVNIDDDDDYDEDEIEQRRSPLLPILFAVASAFVIFSAFLITFVVTEMLERGSKNETMPELRGRTFAEVDAEYGSWLRLNPIMEYSDVGVGIIIRQSEAAGRLFNPSHTIVDVTVSQGQRLVTMPDFSHRAHTEAEVVSELTRLGLFHVTTLQPSDNHSKGTFIKSEPLAGSQIPVGETVRIWISQGREDELYNTIVPVLTGLVHLEAAADAAVADLVVASPLIFEESSEEQRGRVINQSIPHGRKVPRGTVIELTVGAGPSAGRESFIQFAMPEIAQGLFDFVLLRNGVAVDSHSQHMTLGGRQIRFEFKDIGTVEYAVMIRQGGREGIYVVYRIDFEHDEPIKEIIEQDPNVLWDIIQPPTPTTTPATTPYEPPTEPPTTPPTTTPTSPPEA